MKKMRLLPFMAAVLSIIVSGCSKDDDGIEGTVSVIEAKITNVSNSVNVEYVEAQLFDEDYEDYFVVASAEFANGSFRLELPPDVNRSYLYPITEITGDTPSGIKVSNPNAKASGLEFFGLNRSDDRFEVSFYCQTFNPEGNDPDSGAFASFIFSDSDVKITGTITDNDEQHNFTSVTEFNFSLKKGWNTIYTLFEYKDRDQDGYPDYAKTTVSNKTPSGLKWWVY